MTKKTENHDLPTSRNVPKTPQTNDVQLFLFFRSVSFLFLFPAGSNRVPPVVAHDQSPEFAFIWEV